MKAPLLLIFIEGKDDKRFIDSILRTRFERLYKKLRLIKYSKKKAKDICKYIEGLEDIKGNYILMGDLDHFPCISARKNQLKKIFACLEDDNISIVAKAIEGWYLAGLSRGSCKRLHIRKLDCTDSVYKGHFKKIMPRHYKSRSNFMIEILKYFNIKIAMEKNESFKYFIKKYVY